MGFEKANGGGTEASDQVRCFFLPCYRNPDLGGTDFYEAVQAEDRPVRLSQDELEDDTRWQTLKKVALVTPTSNGWLAAPLVGRNGKSMGLLQPAR